MHEDVCLVNHQLGSLSFILIFGAFLFQMELHSKHCEYTLKILEGLIEAKDEEALNMIGSSLEEGFEGKSQYYVLGTFSCT